MNFILKYICLSLILSGEFISRGSTIPNYYISNSEKDATLKITEALFDIHFQGYGAKLDLSKEIIISCNGTIIKAKPSAEGNIQVPVSPGTYQFQFFYNEHFFEIKTSSIEIKPGFRNQMHVNFMSSKFPVCMNKPVIYFYPKKETQVHVKLDIKGMLDFTYPAYDVNKGWNFVAYPNGKLDINGKEHNYLFWEGVTNLEREDQKLQQGFVVQKENVVAFLEKKLSKMGLNSNEKEDFITYWGPLMTQHKQCLVHFMFNEQFAKYASLNITPKPDHLFRVFMLWSPLEEGVHPMPKPQVIPSITREGFTVIEWGGANISKLVNQREKFASNTH